MRRLIRRLLPWGGGIALALLLVTACGIPQFVYLAPPIRGTVTSLPPTATFTHDQDNDTDSFLGYEIYYKFYNPALANVTDAFRSDKVAIENAAPGSVAATLAGLGYRRVYAGAMVANGTVTAQARPPALTVGVDERDQVFTVAMTFPQNSDTTEHATAIWNAGSDRSVVLLRNQAALNDPTEPRGFRPFEIVSSDADIPPLPAGPGTVDMGIAIATYGTDYVTGTFAEIYSTAVVGDRLLGVAYQ